MAQSFMSKLPGRSETSRHVNGFAAFSLSVVAVIAFLALYPLLVIGVRLFWVDGRLSLHAFREVLELPDLGRLILNTLIVVFVSAVIALVIGSLLAWIEQRTDAKMGPVTSVLPLLPFLLPPVAGAVAWVLLLADRAGFVNEGIRRMLGVFGIEMTDGPFSIYSFYGLILVYVVYQVPFVFLMVSAGLKNMSPSLEEQSRMSGAGALFTLRNVTFPALMPSLGGAVLLMAWQGFALFSIPAIIGSPAGIDVLSVRIVRLMRNTYPARTDVAVGLSAVIVAFVVVIWYIQTRLIRSTRYASITGKGQTPTRVRLGRWRWPVRVMVLCYLLVTAILPVMALIVVTLQGFWTPNIDISGFSLDRLRSVIFDDVLTRRAMNNSVYISLIGATAGVLAGAVISVYILSIRRKSAAMIDSAVKLPAVVSNVVLALGFVLAFGGPPLMLSGTLLILGLAYVALYYPQGSVATDAAAAQVGRELLEASRASGAAGARTFRRVSLPLMLPGLVAGWALLFSRMVGDLTASAILSGTRNPVLGYRILEMYENGSFAATAAVSLILVVIVTVVLAVALGYSSRRGWNASGSTGSKV